MPERGPAPAPPGYLDNLERVFVKVGVGYLAFMAMAACEQPAPLVPTDDLAAQAAYYAGLPAAPSGYRVPRAGEHIPEIVMRGLPEGEAGWSILIKGVCYYYRFIAGGADMIYPAPDDIRISWYDPNARSFCGGGHGA